MLARAKRKTGPSKKQQSRAFTLQEADTIIAALRLWQRSPAYPKINIAEEHGDMLDDSAIDDLIEEINFGDVSIPPKPESEINPLRQSDKELAILDAALNVAEDILLPLLKPYGSTKLKAAFLQHVQIHLGEELLNIQAHGHRNDDPDDVPKPTVYQGLVNLAELIAAGNTDYESLERRAKEVLIRLEAIKLSR